jgi:hypothetical protein
MVQPVKLASKRGRPSGRPSGRSATGRPPPRSGVQMLRMSLPRRPMTPVAAIV